MFQLLEGQRVCDTRKNGRIFEITHTYLHTRHMEGVQLPTEMYALYNFMHNKYIMYQYMYTIKYDTYKYIYIYIYIYIFLKIYIFLTGRFEFI